MLRLAKGSRSYDVTVKVAGETVKMKLKSLTLLKRLEFLEEISSAPLTVEGINKLVIALETVVLSIEGHDGPPSELFKQMEHRKDLDELSAQLARWCHLDEQESKNLDSSPVQSEAAPASSGSVEKDAEKESDSASTKKID